MYDNFFKKSAQFNFYFYAVINAVVMYMQNAPVYLIFPLSLIVGFSAFIAYYIGKANFNS
jgi:hypothetical protein